MKTMIVTLLCALLIVSKGAEGATYSDPMLVYPSCDTGMYLKGFGGFNFLHRPSWNHTKYKTSKGYVLGAAVGYKFNPLSLEAELSYRDNSVNHLKIEALDVDVSGSVRQWCGFGNIFFECPLSRYVVPYVGAGAGYRHTKPGVNYDERSDISLKSFINSANEWGVYQLIGGLKFAMTNFASLQLEYRYVDGWSKTDCINHSVDLNACFKF